MNEIDKTPLENPTGKEWFAPDYVKPADAPSNVVRRSFGPGLPPRTNDEGDSAIAEAGEPS